MATVPLTESKAVHEEGIEISFDGVFIEGTSQPNDFINPYKRVCLKFDLVYFHSFLNYEHFDEKNYDVKLIPFRDLFLKDFREYRAAYDKEWFTSSFCPDPGFYEVQQSPLIPQHPLAVKYGYKHYLFVFHLATIDILTPSTPTWQLVTE